MTDPDNWIPPLIMFIVLFTLGGLIGHFVGRKEMIEEKAKCEAALPRNQQCVMQFVPAPMAEPQPIPQTKQQPLT